MNGRFARNNHHIQQIRFLVILNGLFVGVLVVLVRLLNNAIKACELCKCGIHDLSFFSTHYTYPTTINGIIICTCAAPIRIRFQQIASLNCIAGLLIQSHSEHEDNNSTNAIRSTVSTVHSFCPVLSQCNTPPLISVGHLSSDRQRDRAAAASRVKDNGGRHMRTRQRRGF